MNSSKNKSRDECEKMMNEIKKHTELQQKDIMELEQRLTSVNGDKRGLAAVNKFLQNQKNEVMHFHKCVCVCVCDINIHVLFKLT